MAYARYSCERPQTFTRGETKYFPDSTAFDGEKARCFSAMQNDAIGTSLRSLRRKI